MRQGKRWQRAAAAAGLIDAAGAPQPTIFAQMSALALRHQAVNLGQGFPDTDGPDEIKSLVKQAIDEGRNQYPPGAGIPELRAAIAAHQARRYGLSVDPDTEVVVTAGATEAIAASILALVDAGDEVITFEPFYDSYPAVIAMAGGVHVPVPLARTGSRFAVDFTALAAAVTARTTMIVLNSPHNPTGMVFTAAELAGLAEFAARHDLIVVTDEVYEHLVFDDAHHTPIASLPGMAERTLTISSAGKTFSFTGWKTGWVHGPAPLVAAVQAIRQFLTFTPAAPFQPALAWALGRDEFPAALAASLATRRDKLCDGLRGAGFEVFVPEGTYFVVADAAPLGYEDADALARELPARIGVATVPVSALCRARTNAPVEPTPPSVEHTPPLVEPTPPLVEPVETPAPFRSLLRFTFVKHEATIAEAVRRLAALTPR